MPGEPDQRHSLGRMPLAHELADVELAADAHLRRPRVADVRVMLPHDDLRPRALAAEVAHERTALARTEALAALRAAAARLEHAVGR